MSGWRRVTMSLVALGFLASCGDDDEPGATDAVVATAATVEATASTGDGAAPPAGNEEFCGPMEQLANYNVEAPALDATADWPALQSQLTSAGEDAKALYGDAIAVAPDEVKGDLQTLSDYSDDVFAAAQESTSIEEFSTAMGAPPGDVLTATRDIDTYIREVCGFGLTAG